MGFVISGANFGSSQGNSTVTFYGTNLSVINWSSSGIAVQIPAGTPTVGGTVAVTVGGQTGTATFTVTDSFGCS